MLTEFTYQNQAIASKLEYLNSEAVKAINDGVKVYNQGYLLHLLPTGTKQAKQQLDSLCKGNFWKQITQVKREDLKETFSIYLQANHVVDELEARNYIINYFNSPDSWQIRLPKMNQNNSFWQQFVNKANSWLYGKSLAVDQLNLPAKNQELIKLQDNWRRQQEFALYTSKDLIEAADVLAEIEARIRKGLLEDKAIFSDTQEYEDYQRDINDYLKQIEREKHNIAYAMFARLRLTFLSDKPGYDDVVLQLVIDIAKLLVSLPPKITKSRIAIRHGMTTWIARTFATYIQQNGTPELVNKLYKLNGKLVSINRQPDMHDMSVLNIEGNQFVLPRQLAQNLPQEIPAQSLDSIYVDCILLKYIQDFYLPDSKLSTERANYLKESIELELDRVKDQLAKNKGLLISDFETNFLQNWLSLLKQYQRDVEAACKINEISQVQATALTAQNNKSKTTFATKRKVIKTTTITRSNRRFSVPTHLLKLIPEQDSWLDFIFKGNSCIQYFQTQQKIDLLNKVTSLQELDEAYDSTSKLALLLDKYQLLQKEALVVQCELKKTWFWQIKYRRFLQSWLTIIQKASSKVNQIVDNTVLEKHRYDLKEIIKNLQKEEELIDYNDILHLKTKLERIDGYLRDGEQAYQRLKRSDQALIAD
jgi:hypothetical protein